MPSRNFLLAVTLILALGSLEPSTAFAGRTQLSYFNELQGLKEAYDLVKTQYVTEEKVKEKELLYGAVEGMLKKLDDPYTRFMKPEGFESMQTETQGQFGGLGILIGMKDNMLTVIAPMENTPAYRVGIRAGDQIVKVNGATTKGMTVNDAVKLLRGEIGTKVLVSVRREGERNPLDYTIVREQIKVSSVRAKMIDDGTGYAHISQFSQSTGEDLEKAIAGFEKNYQLKGFILDLRNNPGGLLNAAVDVGKVFLGKAKIVSIKGRKGEEVTYASFAQAHKRWPLVVLINEGSASASEIVAGAIHDNKRGILLGRKSFGKGSVQTVLPLQDGSALALTTAYYYTPSGVCIHKVGIQPDITVDLPKLTDAQLVELRLEREKEFDRTIEDSKANRKDVFLSVSKYDTQLLQAIEVLKAASVFSQRVLEPQAPAAPPNVAVNNQAVTSPSPVRAKD
ncbi:MAG: S41 family peptidase [Candidatus Wallbacteria bacterium]|nr:S41 family peptidase [Candidatus Wallbacteria bacterium]